MREEAKLMSQEERDEKLEELRELRQFWRGSGASDPEEQMDIFKVRKYRAVQLSHCCTSNFCDRGFKTSSRPNPTSTNKPDKFSESFRYSLYLLYLIKTF